MSTRLFDRNLVTASVAVAGSLVALCPADASRWSNGAVAGATPSTGRAIRTPIPNVVGEWKRRTLGKDGSLEEARAVAEQARPSVLTKRDPFTPLVGKTCEQRAAEGERVVWEDKDRAMAIVDFETPNKLLIVPKVTANFLTDLEEGERGHLATVAAASCDGLVEAGKGHPTSDKAACLIFVHSPRELGVRQLHIHVRPTEAQAGPFDQAYYNRVTQHMVELLGGRGCR